MLTYNITDYEHDEAGNDLIEINGVCLSSDTKPTSGIVNGSILTEMDTGTVYMYNQAGAQWLSVV